MKTKPNQYIEAHEVDDIMKTSGIIPGANLFVFNDIDQVRVATQYAEELVSCKAYNMPEPRWITFWIKNAGFDNLPKISVYGLLLPGKLLLSIVYFYRNYNGPK